MKHSEGVQAVSIYGYYQGNTQPYLLLASLQVNPDSLLNIS
jgi:hypothetical protein